jgi:hypothetical protein
MQTVINLGTLLSPTSSAGTSFTLTPLKAVNTAENILTTAVPVIDGTNVPKVIVNGGSASPKTLVSVDESATLIRPAFHDGNIDVDRFQLRDFGSGILKDPISTSSYNHLNKHGVNLNFDTIHRPVDPLSGNTIAGEAFPKLGEVSIYRGNNPTTREAISTMVHESSHIDRHMRGIPQNTRYEEYRAFTRQFLYDEGRKPTLSERKEIWEDINDLYQNLPAGKSPFGN